MSKHDGGPVFPTDAIQHTDEDGCITEIDEGSHGMTLRDWYAGQALAGILAGWHDDAKWNEHRIAVVAYEFADAMVAERNKS